jgi:hypothetical protein
MVKDGNLINFFLFSFLYTIMFLSAYMWPCCTGYDEDVIFEDDEEEDEAYFFAGQGTLCNSQNFVS